MCGNEEEKKEQLTESLNLRTLSDQNIVQDEEVTLSHQDAIMDHNHLQILWTELTSQLTRTINYLYTIPLLIQLI